MYQNFKVDVLSALSDMEPAMLACVAAAMDTASVKYSITETGTALAVVGREEFQQVAAAYLITKRTEGLSPATIANTGRMLDMFILAMNKPIEQIRANDIRAYLFRYQDERGVSNRSLDGLRSRLCSFFHWCAAEEYIPKDPTANMKPIKYTAKPRKALSQMELEKVRRACRTERETCIVEVLYSTGCRVSELCGIRIDDVDFDKREVLVLGKGGKYRTVYLNAKALISVQAYLHARPHVSPYLICNDRGGGQLTRGNVEKIFRRIEAETGVRVTPHIMRHTMATQALTGTGVEVVQQMLGHSNIATTMIYAEVDPRSIHTAHDRSVI